MKLCFTAGDDVAADRWTKMSFEVCLDVHTVQIHIFQWSSHLILTEKSQYSPQTSSYWKWFHVATWTWCSICRKEMMSTGFRLQAATDCKWFSSKYFHFWPPGSGGNCWCKAVALKTAISSHLNPFNVCSFCGAERQNRKNPQVNNCPNNSWPSRVLSSSWDHRFIASSIKFWCFISTV